VEENNSSKKPVERRNTEAISKEDALLEMLAEILFDKWLEDKNKKING
jgi:hypothetical protein